VRIEPRLPDEGVNVTPEHPLKDVAHLLATALLVGLAVVFVVGLVVDFAVRYVSPEREARIFGSLGSTLIEGLSDGADQAAEKALQPLFERVVAQAPALPYPFKLRVLCNEGPNAVAVPGGTVGVTSGLLSRLQSENELAFVLGHELGHFGRRHHLRNLGRGVVVGVILGGLLASAGVDLGSPTGWVLEGALKSHSREQEIEADLAGAGALVKLYGHMAGAREVMHTLSEATSESALDRLDFTRTHPVGAARVAALEAAALEKGWTKKGETRPLPAGIRGACAQAK
jgi:beta-barrel assembly-enhancing protease